MVEGVRGGAGVVVANLDRIIGRAVPGRVQVDVVRAFVSKGDGVADCNF